MSRNSSTSPSTDAVFSAGRHYGLHRWTLDADPRIADAEILVDVERTALSVLRESPAVRAVFERRHAA